MSIEAFGILFLLCVIAVAYSGMAIERYLKRRPWPREQHHTYFSTCKRVSEE